MGKNHAFSTSRDRRDRESERSQIKWGGRWDSNPRRPESQSGALPAELRPPSSCPINHSRRLPSGHPGARQDCAFAFPDRHASAPAPQSKIVPDDFVEPATVAVSRPAIRANGAPGRTRTCDPRLRRPMLYPAELRAPSSHSRHAGSGPVLARSSMVGAEGFEPPTLCSQSRCATRLRHAPPDCYCCSAASLNWQIRSNRLAKSPTPHGTANHTCDLPHRQFE
jgi:hypothetical protein